MSRIKIHPRARPGAPTIVEFSFTEDRPSLGAAPGRAYQSIRALLQKLSPARRAAVLLNVCVSEDDDARMGGG